MGAIAKGLSKAGVRDGRAAGMHVSEQEGRNAEKLAREARARNPHVADHGADTVKGHPEGKKFTAAPTEENKKSLKTTEDLTARNNANPPRTGEDHPIDGKGGKLTIGDRLNKIKSMLPSTQTLIFGLSVVGMAGFVSSKVDATEAVSAQITSITIASSTSSGTVLTIAYTPPNAMYTPCIHDSIDLSGDIPIFGGQSGLKVTALPSTTSIQVTSTTSNIKTFPSSSSPSQILMHIGSFIDHTSVANQLESSVVGVGTIVADTAAEMAGVVISDAGSVAGAAGGALGGAICSTFKILCNKWLWLGILFLIIAGIVLAVMSKTKK
jgi:hypothetical protein